MCCMHVSAAGVAGAARESRDRVWEAVVAASCDQNSQESFIGRLCFAQNDSILVHDTTCKQACVEELCVIFSM